MFEVNLLLIVLVVASFITSFMSAIASGGGGFVMTPLYIFYGLSPAEAIATGKINGLATTVGSLGGMKATRMRNKKMLVVLLMLAMAAGLLAPKVIINLQNDAYVAILGLILIAMSPIIYIRKLGHVSKTVSKNHQIMGYIATFIALFVTGVFSSGLGIFISMAIMSGLGLNALEANISKRLIQLVLNSTIVVSLFTSGLIIWKLAAILSISNLLGSYFGGKLAVKKGPKFISVMLAVLAFISGVALLIEAAQ